MSPHDAILAALRAEVATALDTVTRAEHAAGDATTGPIVTHRNNARIRLAALRHAVVVAEGVLSASQPSHDV